ncbi:MAG TPA: MBL fold metallo-hydrolase [Candidatus Polarisedimenticolia bacterium]|nr:MBL fold metallo-hydrolase [Candidatus Polarisedimenticolia bacterium]
MIVESFPVGPLQCNCVVLGDEATREAIVIDPGDEAERIEETLDHYRLHLKHVVHTHGHIDHILAANHLRTARQPEVAIHEADLFLWEGVQMQAAWLGLQVGPAGPIDRFLKEGEAIPFGPHRLTVIETPGHTPGSVCFLLSKAAGSGSSAPLLFSGDTLFQHGIGRTDLWGGSYPSLERSILRRLYTLDEETLVRPGHGPDTTIGEEMRNNPFVTSLHGGSE